MAWLEVCDILTLVNSVIVTPNDPAALDSEFKLIDVVGLAENFSSDDCTDEKVVEDKEYASAVAIDVRTFFEINCKGGAPTATVD